MMRWVFAAVACFCVAYSPCLPAQAIPSELSEVDSWWEHRLAERSLPEVRELVEGEPDNAATVRAFDLMLQRYQARKQVYKVHGLAGEGRSCCPGTLLALWGQAWHVWLATLYPRENATEDDLRLAIAALSRDQSQSLRSLTLSYPHELTGALALRLLVLGVAEGPFEPDGELAELGEQITLHYPGGVCASVIAMERGVTAERRGDMEAAAGFWLEGLGKYPFPGELGRWRSRLVDVLSSTENQTQARLLAEYAPNHRDLADLTRELLEIRRARALAEKREEDEALRLLDAVRERVGMRAKDFVLWREVLQEIDLELARVRSMAGLGDPIDLFLDQLRTSRRGDYPGLLAQGMVKFATSPRFCNAAISMTRDRLEEGEMRGGHAESLCWATLARAEGADPAVRAQAYRCLLEYSVRRLNLLRLTWRSGGLVLQTIGRAVRERMVSEEDTLLDMLEETEEFVLRCGTTAEVMDLVDTLYTSYRSLGISNLPNNLYLRLSRGATDQHRQELARRAERMGQVHESIAILEIVLDSQRLASVDGEPSAGTLEELLRIFLVERDYGAAAKVACELAEDASGTPQAGRAWYEAADLLYKANEYGSAREVLRVLLSDPEIDSRCASEAEKLLAFAEFRLGRYEESRALVEKMKNQGTLDYEEEKRFAKMLAYSYFYRHEYEKALVTIQEVLGEYAFEGAEKRDLERLVKELQAFNRR
jgi:hypothetical protein